MTRVVPLMLLIGPLFAVDAALGLGYLNPFNLLATVTVLAISLVGGCGYGVFVGRRIIGKLQEKGVFRPSRKDLYFLGLAVIVAVSGFLWLVVSVGSVFLHLAMLAVYSFLPATFVTEGVVLWRWERTTGRKVEYEGAWAIKATVKPARAPA